VAHSGLPSERAKPANPSPVVGGAVLSFQKNCVYRFGAFEFDPRTAELRKNGMKLKLQDQPRQVLVQLLEHPGEVISRERLGSLLWPKGTFVDFETGLNTAVKRLRDTLGESAENPTFIETIPRKGYKFIAPVEKFEPDGYKPAVVTPTAVRTRKNIPAIASISAVALLLIGGAILWRNLPRLPAVTNVVQLTNDAWSKSFENHLPVTDGVHVYFVEGDPTARGSGIVQISAAGGETSQLLTPLREVSAIYAIAPNFSELLVGNGIGLPPDPATGRAGGALEVWIQPLPGGTPHRVGNFWATSACYTPDGTRILYADGRSLITVNRDGSNPRELAKLPEQVYGLRYSPNGKRIRFSLTGGRWVTSSLWQVDANGSNLHPLLQDWKESPFQCCGNWSPDGNNYFFQAGQGNDQAIWVMPEHRFGFMGARGRPSRLITGPLHLSAPVPSADGKKLFVTGEQLRVEAVRYDSKTRRFESYLFGTSISSFEFSPDGKWIAYVSYPDMSVWRCRVDGTEKMQLTFPPVRAYAARWSPDGSKIAFADSQFNHPSRISLISSSGGPPQSLPSAPPGDNPSWLPGGNSIIYGQSQSDDKIYAILRQDLDTGRIVRIPNSDGYYSPQVSPDGRYISAFSLPSNELLLFDSKTNRWSSLAKGEVFGYNIWSHDGRYIYVRSIRGGSSSIVRVRISDARMEEVVSLKDLPQVTDVFTGWIGLTPEGDPVAIRDRSTQEIYALNLH